MRFQKVVLLLLTIIILALQIACSSIKLIAMQRWQQLRRQKIHENKIEHAKPTLKRYSKSRQKSVHGPSRQSQGNQTINQPFNELLRILQLQKYQNLLYQHGFPSKIKNKDTPSIIQSIMPKVHPDDSQKFLSFLTALLQISTQMKSNKLKMTIPKRQKNLQLPPSHHSSNLKKSGSIATKRPNKTPNFRIKSKTNLNRNQINESPVSRVSELKTTVERIKAKDDSGIIHNFGLNKKGNVVHISKSVFLLQRIDQKISKIKGFKNQIQGQDINLYYKQISEMYLSYDTATLTSNISNIDIEEIIECYAIELETKMAESKYGKTPLNPQYTQKITRKQSIKKLLKQSLLQQKIKENLQENGHLSREAENCMDDTVSVGSSVGSQTQVQQSKQFFDLQLQSMTYDLSCFNSRFEDEAFSSCNRADIKNFIQLVMMAGKMEKETPIISYCYLMRVLNICHNEQINVKNWKNLLLITLIEASKIWDDQSLQNHSFSKVIKPYTTLQINRLQRHLLNVLNYNLKVQARQYCASYFNLRKHSKQANKTANLMPLTLQMIKKLQSGVKKSERKLKETYKKKLNQSF